MASYNRVILMGNLTRDPEMRYSQGDKSTAICKIGLAVNHRYKAASGEWVDKPNYVDVTLFGNRAEAFEKYHRKGSTAFIEGRLDFDSWEDKNTGQKRSKLSVIAENWEFAGGRGEGTGSGGGGGGGGGRQPAPQPPESPEDGYGGGGGGGYTTAPSGGESTGGSGSFDDTPF